MVPHVTRAPSTCRPRARPGGTLGGEEVMQKGKNECAVSICSGRELSLSVAVLASLSAALRGRCSHLEVREQRLGTHGTYLRPLASPSRA